MFLVNKTELLKYVDQQPEGVKWILPDFDFETPYYGLEITELKVSTESLDIQNYNDDLWTSDRINFFLSKSKLEQLAIAGGVKFTRSRISFRELDEDKLPIYVASEVGYVVLSKDKEVISDSMVGEYSYYNDLQTIVYGYDFADSSLILHKAGEPIYEIINRRRLNATMTAEASAKKKILSSIFPRLKWPFSYNDLKQKILIGKITKDKKTVLSNHPNLQKDYVAEILGLGNLMYGRTVFTWGSYSDRNSNLGENGFQQNRATPN